MTENQELTTTSVQEQKQAYLDKLIQTYDKIFEMEMIEGSDIGLVATAHYMQYAKKAFMRAERHEYVFIYDLAHLDKAAFDAINNATMESGLDKIQPTKGYLSSFLTAVILTETMDEEAKELIEKNAFIKNLKKIKKGYVNLRICAVDFTNTAVTHNRDSKELGDFLVKFFQMPVEE